MNAVRFCPGAVRPPARALTAIVLAAVTISLADAARAGAVILPAKTIDGPSEDIVGFGGAAMAEDGTGGLVYLKRVGGVPHVFVSRYAAGQWQAPIQVDTEEHFGASWPRIGAAEGGELIVVWATPFATEHGHPVYELLGSELAPGSSTFGRPAIVDPYISEATGTSPDLAVTSTGQADVVYRVVNFSSAVPLLRPSDVVESVRVASFNGERWSSLGADQPGTRTLDASRRRKRTRRRSRSARRAAGSSSGRSPKRAASRASGRGGSSAQSLDYVMPVTATSYNGVPISNDADAPAVAISKLGQAEVAYRQPYAPGSPLPGARIFLNTLPDGESESGAQFLGARHRRPLDRRGQAGVGRAAEHRRRRTPRNAVALRRQRASRASSNGRGKGVLSSSTLGTPFSGSLLGPAPELASAAVVNPEDGGVSAWPSTDAQGRPGVGVREDFPNGAVQTALLSGGAGGPIGEIAVGRSGLGDGLVAFQQGPIGNAAIVGAQVTAPPAPFAVTLPKALDQSGAAPRRVGRRPKAPTGRSPTSPCSTGGPMGSPQTGLSYTFPPPLGLDRDPRRPAACARHLRPGDPHGRNRAVKVDGTPPRVRLTRRGLTVVVQVSDTGVGARPLLGAGVLRRRRLSRTSTATRLTVTGAAGPSRSS